MNRDQMLKKLQSIEGTLVTQYGGFDTGIEFRRLTSEGGTFVYGPGEWPVSGPYSYSKPEKELCEQLFELGFDVNEPPTDEDELKDCIEQHGQAPWPEEKIAAVIQMDFERYWQIMWLAANECSAGRDYFFYDDEGEVTTCDSEEEAVLALLDDYADDETPWEEMDDDLLQEYIDELGCIKMQIMV